MYKIELSLNAQEDLERIELYYFNISEKIADKFIESTIATYEMLKINPHFSIRHKHYHTISIEKFPYLFFFEIEEQNKTISILSCFHTSQNPEKYPL